jgi:hypothetical protein
MRGLMAKGVGVVDSFACCVASYNCIYRRRKDAYRIWVGERRKDLGIDGRIILT